VPTAAGCNLTWVMAMKPNGVAARLGMSLGRPVMARTFQKFLYNLRDYTDKRVRQRGLGCLKRWNSKRRNTISVVLGRIVEETSHHRKKAVRGVRCVQRDFVTCAREDVMA
jgi:hypothetical protein